MGSAIIIFVRHPELGKVKTRLAADIGEEKALKVYQFLLRHTHALVRDLRIPVYIFYADKIIGDDQWTGPTFVKKQQVGDDLGMRIINAMLRVFNEGFTRVMIIGSDCAELTSDIIQKALNDLSANDVVIGPAKDGGYYLLGMRYPFKNLFGNKAWSTDTVFADTMNEIRKEGLRCALLPRLSDVDTAADINFNYE